MRRTIVGVIAWGMTALAANAEEPVSPQSVETEVVFGQCHFKLKDPYGADFRATRSRLPPMANYIANVNTGGAYPFEIWIQFSCQDPATAQTLSERALIKMTDKGWVLDPTPGREIIEQQHTTFYPLHGKGWIGGGTTQDDVNGDEARRMRTFNFCIPHRQLAVCGYVDVGYLLKPKESVFPQVIQLLQSIEFIDMQAVVPADTANP